MDGSLSGFLVALELAGCDVLVVGGGVVAERKIAALLEAGAAVRVVAPELTSALRELAAAGRLAWLARGWQPGDAAGARLVIAATSDPEVNRAVAAEARASGTWCNVAAPPEAGDVQLLATVRDGPLAVGISTGGASPFVARRVRELLEAALPAGIGTLVELLGEVRERVQATHANEAARRAAYERIWSGQALARIQAGDLEGARAVVAECVEEPPGHD